MIIKSMVSEQLTLLNLVMYHFLKIKITYLTSHIYAYMLVLLRVWKTVSPAVCNAISKNNFDHIFQAFY